PRTALCCSADVPTGRRPRGSALFPYTTLFRSTTRGALRAHGGQAGARSAAPTARAKHGRRAVSGVAPEARRARPNLWPFVPVRRDRKSTRLNSSHVKISYAVFCLNKKKATRRR